MKRILLLLLLLLPLLLFFSPQNHVTAQVGPTSAPTSAPTPEPNDVYEPNNTPDTAATLRAGETLTAALPQNDIDYFQVYLKQNDIVTAATYPDPGHDTRIYVYRGGELIGTNDDRAPNDRGSAVTWQAAVEGWHQIAVDSPVPYTQQYRIVVSLQMPTATPTPPPSPTPGPANTPTPTATPYTTADQGEPNNDPTAAYEILPGFSYQMSLGPVGVDTHDFYAMLIKPDTPYTCAVTPQDPVDPTVRIYAGPVGQGVLIAENDDAAADNIGSKLSFDGPYDGVVYIVVEGRAGYGRYTLLCESVAPIPAAGGAVVVSPTPTLAPTPDPTANPLRPLHIQMLATAPDDDNLARVPVQLAYDVNANGQADPGEGVQGVEIQAYNGDNQVLSLQTNQNGAAILIAQQYTRVYIPFLAWSADVSPGDNEPISIIIPAMPLPVIMPVESAD